MESVEKQKQVAFVFDDGPHEEQRMKMLEVLEQLQLRVTFACIGNKIEARPDLAKAAAKAGHEQVNHSWSHPYCDTLSLVEFEQQLTLTRILLEQTTGCPAVWYWPPFLQCDEIHNDQVEALGMKTFSRLGIPIISTRDYDRTVPAEDIFKFAITEVPHRALILCHEWRVQTLEVLSAIVEELKTQGFAFVTFSEMAASLE